jgi:hypothetical protein
MPSPPMKSNPKGDVMARQTTKADLALEAAQARLALRALDKLLDFSEPDQFLMFRPKDEPDLLKAWKRADAILRPKS